MRRPGRSASPTERAGECGGGGGEGFSPSFPSPFTAGALSVVDQRRKWNEEHARPMVKTPWLTTYGGLGFQQQRIGETLLEVQARATRARGWGETCLPAEKALMVKLYCRCHSSLFAYLRHLSLFTVSGG
jgi:hypothetical protein